MQQSKTQEQERKEHKGVQIKYQLSWEDYKRLRSVRTRFGFGSDYEFSAACVRLILRTLDQATKDRAYEDQYNTHKEIGGLFAGLADAEYMELGRVERSDRARMLNLIYPDARDAEIQCHGIEATPTPVILRNRMWANAFVTKHYQRLYRRCQELDECGDVRGRSPYRDMLGDVMMWLYECDKEFDSYAAFEAYALKKVFTKAKR